MRKSIWKQKVSKQATRALFLAKYLLQNTSETNSDIRTSKLKSTENDGPST